MDWRSSIRHIQRTEGEAGLGKPGQKWNNHADLWHFDIRSLLKKKQETVEMLYLHLLLFVNIYLII